jgi:hypothetical protein
LNLVTQQSVINRLVRRMLPSTNSEIGNIIPGIIDSGCSQHMIMNAHNLRNIKESNNEVVIANGTVIRAKYAGDLVC